MASSTQVRTYLARWFQLGKSVQIANSEQTYCPNNSIDGNQYSSEFEACWQALQKSGLENCYLENTSHSLATLSQSDWDLQNCARCDMPIALRVGGVTPLDCPCSDQENWPVLELPAPQAPQDWNLRIRAIGQRLKQQYKEASPH